jgi:hypothetical protein
MYTCYVLTNETINKLKKIFKQHYPDFIGHHITVEYGVSKNHPLPLETDDIYVIGEASEGGVQALLVSIDGTIERSDGSLYHITWSIDRSKGKRPVDSNSIIKKAKRVEPIKIEATPQLLN